MFKNCRKRVSVSVKRLLAASECKHIFCLKAIGDSMEPTIKDGDTIFVHKREKARSGNLVAALVDKKDLSICRLILCGNKAELQPLNKERQTKAFEGKERKRLKILGVVKSVSRTVT